MFSLVKEQLRLAHVNPRTETHGDEDVLAVDLKLEFETSNAVLLKFSPTLRDALYTQDPGVTKDMINPDHAPVLRNPQIGDIKWMLEIPYVRFSVFVDGTNDEDIIFAGAKCNNFKFMCKEGGTVIVIFRIQMSEPLEVDVTKLLFLMGKMIKVNLEAQEEPEDYSGGEEAAQAASRPDNVVGLFDAPGPDDHDDQAPDDGQADAALAGDAEEEPTGDTSDPLYQRAVGFVRDLNKAKPSILQRNLHIEHDRAVRMLETMESEGIVGPADGKGMRDVVAVTA